MFKNLFSFNGRIRRTEFGISFIIYFVLYCILYAVFFIDQENSASVGIGFLCFIPILWFLWSQGAKRCHDLGHNGWWQIIPFYVFWLLFADGVTGPNEYGEDPKGRVYEYESYTSPIQPQSSPDNDVLAQD